VDITPDTRESSRWRFLIAPKWLGWHVFVIFSFLVMLWLSNWQLHRAESGNSLSWAYTFEWPLFAIFAVVFWVKTIRDEAHPPVQAKPMRDAFVFPGGVPMPSLGAPRTLGGEEPAEDDEELAPYNAYLARLTEEVRGHGRWHGLR
jgi:DNA-binding transcriptional regulator of glucitol operon